MHVQGLMWGARDAAGYLVFDRPGGAALVVDAPPGATKRILQACKEKDLRIAMLVNTHGHWEQIAENAALVEQTGAPLCAHAWDAARLANPTYTMFEHEMFAVRPSCADRSIRDGDVLEAGALRFEALHTPGHSPGSVCLYGREEGVLFSGDTLLRHAVGGTDIPGGDPEAMAKSLRRLNELPITTRVFPAHGFSTTIREERWLLELALAGADGNR